MPLADDKPFWAWDRYRSHCGHRIPRWLVYRKLDELEAIGIRHEDLPPLSNYAIMQLSLDDLRRLTRNAPGCGK